MALPGLAGAPGALDVQRPGKPWPLHELNARGAGYVTLKIPNYTSGTTWRARFSVQESLSGIDDTAARVRHFPELLRRRLRTGNMNIPVNPFSKGLTPYGPATDVVSEEIYEK